MRPFRFAVSATHAASGRDWRENARRVEDLGYDVLLVTDHITEQLAPLPALVAAADVTSRLRIGSFVFDNDYRNPVMLAKEAATVDLLSGGRAEIMAGRGSFIESFPLFGYDLHDYDALFSDKLELLLALRDNERVSWGGRSRPAFQNLGVYPRPVQRTLPVWIAVGGTPQSVVRAARLGLPLAIAIIGGTPEQFVPMVELYRETAERAGHDRAALPISINSHAFVGESSDAAADAFYPSYAAAMTRIGRERGWPPTTRRQFDAARSSRGALLVGDPQEVVDKVLREHELFHHQRFLAQMDVGCVSHAALMQSIELLGTRVAPAIRKALAT